jgi:hypothetical protein
MSVPLRVLRALMPRFDKKKDGRPLKSDRVDFCEAVIREMEKGYSRKTAIARAQKETGYPGKESSLQVRFSNYLKQYGGRPRKPPTKP